METVSQSDFAFGELSPEYAASETEARRRSVKRGRNTRILNSYGLANRLGSRFVAQLSGAGVVANLRRTGGEESIAFIRAQGIDIYSTEGALLQSVSGAPWLADHVLEVTWLARTDKLFISHQSFWPRVLTWTGSEWSLVLHAFSSGPGNSLLQPYYRFAAAGIAMTPSGFTGSITVTFSADVLFSAHAGTRFRYGADYASLKEIEIVSVTDARTATATVADRLPPTMTVTVADASGFRIGEDVQGANSSARGVIAAIVGNDVTVIMSQFFEGFEDTLGNEEYLVGPGHKSKIATGGSNAAASPAASTVWDEQAFSNARLYPGDVFERRGRLGFADLPGIPNAILLSAPGDSGNFDPGEGTVADAIFWTSGTGNERVLYCVSASQLIVLSDRRISYVPETADIPLAADTFALSQIAPIGASAAFPTVTEDGVVFAERGGNRIMAAYQTGTDSAQWALADLTRRHSHQISNPVALAQTGGNAEVPERYVFALNGDGTLACMFYDRNPDRAGWTPWDTNGAYTSMVTIAGVVFAVCRRTVFGVERHFLERLSSDAQLDASSPMVSAGAATLIDSEGDFIVDDDGDMMAAESGGVSHLAGETVHVVRGTEYLGEHEASASGTFPTVEAEDGNFEAGFHFETDIVLWPAAPDGDRSENFSKRSAIACAVSVHGSCVYTVGIEGRDLVNTRAAYDFGDDMSAAPPLRSEVKRFTLAGRETRPSVQIKRPLPQPLTVIGVKTKVTAK